MIRRPLTTLVVLGVVVGSGSPRGVAQSGSAPGVPRDEPTVGAAANALPDGLSADDWSGIRAAYEAGRHGVFAVEGGHRARNPGQRWATVFDGRGFTTTPDAGGWAWGLELVGYGWGRTDHEVAVPAGVTAEGQRVAYAWDDRLTEWYRNDRRGLEHGYTVQSRPEAAGGELTLELAVRGGLLPVVSSDGRDVRFVDATGGAALTYAGLVVLDADGRALTAGWEATGERLRLRIEDGSARYPLTIDPVAQQAYLKASNTDIDDHFGIAIAISGDTVVVGAEWEDSAATGVNGDQGSNAAFHAGAAYVFVRNGATWTQQAYLKASNAEAVELFGSAVAVSGNTVVIGAHAEDSAATGVDGDQEDNTAEAAGAAYVFVRNGASWTQQAYLKASNTGANDRFGTAVAVSGDTVVVGAPLEDSAATGVDGDQGSDAVLEAGAAYVFVRNGATWTQQAYLKASNTGSSDSFGDAVAISGDTVVVGAQGEDSAASGVNGDQGSNAIGQAGAAYVFVRNGTTWSQQAYLKASNPGPDQFARAVAISGDTVVVGAPAEQSAATGVDGDQSSNAAINAGAAYVFVRDGSTWSQQTYLKASNTGSLDSFGTSVAVSGNAVVVGARDEDSAAAGVDGNQASNAANGAGAAYAFVRSGTTWTQQAYLKASNTDSGDRFGIAVGVSGGTAVVGANFESSAATGVDGNQSSNVAFFSGAAYVFDLDVSGPWTDLGGGTSGIGGPPLLVMSGPLTASSLLSLDLLDGPAAALTILFVSSSSTPTAFLGGTLHAFPYDELLVLGTDGAGEMHGAVVFPPGVPSGTELWFQVGLADASVPIHGASLSNGVVGTVP